MSCKKIISGWTGWSLPILMHNVRNYNSLKLEEFFDHFMKSTDDLDSLKVLHIILQLNPDQRLTVEVTIALTAALCDAATSNLVKVVCSHILRASLPNKAINIEDLPRNRDCLLLICMLMLHNKDETEKHPISDYSSPLLGLMTSSEKNSDSKSNTCKILAQISGHKIALKDSDTFAQQLKQMLCFESQIPAHPPMKKFTQLSQIDDVSAQHFVTVLSLATSNVKELQTNVHAFSALRQLWPNIFDAKETSTATKELRCTVVDYCFRVIEQTERVPLKTGEDSIQHLALVESLFLLDLICLDDENAYVRVFPVIRRIYDQTSCVNVAICALQIFLHQTPRTNYDPQTELNKFFTRYVTNSLTNQCSSFEVVQFLKRNLITLNSTNPSPLRTWFPSIFQVLAWHPLTFLEEFLEFVPTFMNETTAIEVLHCILDLPCLSAALTADGREIKDSTNRLSPAQLRAMLDFVLRKKSGKGETIEGILCVFQQLQDSVKHPRVVVAANCVVPLLEVYFEVINDFGNAALAEKLLVVILERSCLLFPVPNLLENVQRLLSEQLLELMKQYPHLVGTLKPEISDFLSSAKPQSQDLCLHLTWAVGQYTSSVFWPNCTLEIVRSYYETMECHLYEHLTSTPYRMVSVTFATMVKLASRCQDLVPRVLLCLSKVISFAQSMASVEWTMVASRAEEFVAILGEPNVAAMALSPSADSLSNRQHNDACNLPALWRATSAFVSALPFQSQLH